MSSANQTVDPEAQDHHVQDGKAPYEGMSVRRYLATRVTTLKPPMLAAPNPWKLVRMLDRRQWNFFFVAFFAWTWDAFDFFTVSLTVEDLAETFGKTNTDITWGITLVLMFRSVGSVIFGIAADRYGRKWPFVVNNFLFIVLELGTGFCQTYQQFLACRALFGVAMGGLYGNAAATALEDLPEETRGLMSGILQQGYAFGYLLAAAFSRALVNTTPHGWRPLYWFGACPPVLFIIWRLTLPETQAFQARQRLRQQASRPAPFSGDAKSGEEDAAYSSSPSSAHPSATSTFLREGAITLRRHYLLLAYLVLLMAGFNFASHGSQDLYPTLLSSQFGFSQTAVTVTQVVANLGAMLGGTMVGYLSQIFGRRLCIILSCILGGALLYPYTFVQNEKVMAAAFFTQFAVQGAWGVIPVHLMELSPGSLRAFVVGTAYQLGNLASSASSTIESRLGERFPLPPANGEARYDYGKVICIFMACVFVYVIILTFLGPERLRRSFDVEDDVDAREAAGVVRIDETSRQRNPSEGLGPEGKDEAEKEVAGEHREKSATHRE